MSCHAISCHVMSRHVNQGLHSKCLVGEAKEEYMDKIWGRENAWEFLFIFSEVSGNAFITIKLLWHKCRS